MYAEGSNLSVVSVLVVGLSLAPDLVAPAGKRKRKTDTYF